MTAAPHATPRGSPYLRDAAAFRGLSLVAVERHLVEAGVSPGEPRRAAHLALFGLWLDLAERASTAAAWTGETSADPVRIAAQLGVAEGEIAQGLELAAACGALGSYRSDRESRQPRAHLVAGVLGPATDAEAVVAWARCVEALRGSPAAVQACRALAARTARPAELAPARIEDLAALAHYSPNALRRGVQEAVRAGVLVTGATTGPRREYAFSDWALGRDAAAPRGSTAPARAPAAPTVATPAPAAVRELIPLTIGDVAVSVPKGVTVSITRKRAGHEDETFVIRVED